MAFFQDLTPYQYFGEQEPPGLAPLNVGWLSRNQSFAAGKTSQEFKEKLFEYHYVAEHQYRPPDEFIEAVIRGLLPGSEEHEALLAKYRQVR